MMNRLYARCSTFGGVDRRCEHCRGELAPMSLDTQRSDARFCSHACRQRAYRARRRAPKSDAAT